jgi:Sugar phosphate isomerases/epimerases
MLLGVQTYTIRRAARKDLRKALVSLLDEGFSSFELAYIPFSKRNALIVSSLQKERPFVVTSLMVKPKILASKPEEIVSFARMVKAKNIVISRLSLKGILGGEKDLASFAEEINHLVALYAKEGLTVAYHHHYWEYVQLPNGETKLSFLLRRCPDLRFVNDTFWSARAGKNPVAQIKEFGKRLIGVHLRDIADEEAGLKVKTNDCELGRGFIDFHEVIAAAKEAGAEYCAVEQKTITPLESLMTSRTYLKKEGLLPSFDNEQ